MPAANVSKVTKKLLEENYDGVLYTDGACSGNPGPGGWGASLWRDGEEADYCLGSSSQTTNNIMELTAALNGVLMLMKTKTRGSKFLIVVDSQYVLNGVVEWSEGWKKRNWVKADGKPVANKQVWQELLAALERAAKVLDLTWCWTKGHAGNVGNERADQLARGMP